MRTAISGPDEFDGEVALRTLANAALARAGQPSEDGEFLREVERVVLEGSDW